MRTIAITGASGYVGRSLAQYLERHGFTVLRLGRHGADRHFTLGEPLSPDLLDGVDALIHAAWDVRVRTPEAQASNVSGSVALFEQARASGVRRCLFISSMAAFTGCQSTYGRTKLEVEAAVNAMGGTVIRPGVLYGGEGGGLFQALEGLVSRSPVLPLVGGAAKLPLLHMHDLEELIRCLIKGTVTSPPVTSVANPELVTFRDVLRAIAGSLGRRVILVPVPTGLVMGALRLVEICGLSPRTGSDSLRSLLNSNPRPDLAAEVAGIRPRPFRLAAPGRTEAGLHRREPGQDQLDADAVGRLSAP